MKRYILPVLPLLILFCSIANAQDIRNRIDTLVEKKAKAQGAIAQYNEKLEALRLTSLQHRLRKSGIPKVEKGEALISHQAMMLVYDEQHEQAKWVAHKILPQIEDGSLSRTDNFRPDPKVESGTARQQDYFQKETHDGTTIYDGYGYDRGHLAPSADFKWSKAALDESYYYSNITPQLPAFNRQGWADLEMLLRDYVTARDVPLTVVTGPVLADTLPQIERSRNDVSIPNKFFKVVYDPENQSGIAFLMPHRELQYPAESFTVTIDSVERLTGINFFANLADQKEQKIESLNQPSAWLTDKQKGDVPPIPMKHLGKGRINTVKARQYMGKSVNVEVCGKVVSTHQSEDGHVFINLDKSFPNQIFSATIWSSDLDHFHYDPTEELLRKNVCLHGQVKEHDGNPSMYLQNEEQVHIEPSLWEDVQY